MKKLGVSILIGVFVSSFYLASAQNEDDAILYSKKITSEDTPQAVKDALKKDFPDAVEDIKYFMVPENIVESEWGAAMKESLKEGEGSHYTVQVKGKGGGYVYGLYNSKGDLEVLKMEAHDFELPAEVVKAATSGKYEGYEIKSQKYKSYKIVDKRTEEEYIQVNVEKGDDKKILYFSTDGQLVKEKG